MDGVSFTTESDAASLDVRSPVLILDNNVVRNEAVIERCITRYREAKDWVRRPETLHPSVLGF